MKALFLASALSLAVFSAPAAIAQDGMIAFSPEGKLNPNEAVLSLSVTENIAKAPDRVIISAGVETNADTASAALSQNSAKMNSVIAALKKAGIADKNIQTSGINVSPRYRYDQSSQEQVMTGYSASNMVTIKSDNIDDAGKLIDALVGAGATNLNGPQFTLANPDPVVDEARSKAIASANNRARIYMQAGGFTGMRILSISEQNMGGPVIMASARMMAMDAAPKATPVQPGEVETGITVTVRYALSK